jgi:hypothetical protein
MNLGIEKVLIMRGVNKDYSHILLFHPLPTLSHLLSSSQRQEEQVAGG